LDAAGRRALQATFEDERDATLWKDVLASFALRVLAVNGWLAFNHRKLGGDDATPAANAAAADSGYCSIQ
jgi:hypothetical protein